jgi:hypothetical protein
MDHRFMFKSILFHILITFEECIDSNSHKTTLTFLELRAITIEQHVLYTNAEKQLP